MVDEVGAAQVVHLLLPAGGQGRHQLLGPLVPLFTGLLPALMDQEPHMEQILPKKLIQSSVMQFVVVVLSIYSCTYCKTLWIKVSPKCPKC